MLAKFESLWSNLLILISSIWWQLKSVLSSKERLKRELWNLDYTIAKFVYPRLVEFKRVSQGHPGNLTPEEWDKILDDMIYAFGAVCSIFETDCIIDTERYDRGMQHFVNYYRNLWT